MTDDSVRDQLISSVAKYASNGKSNIPFGDWYNTGDGTANGFKARPVVGGHVALVSTISNSVSRRPHLSALVRRLSANHAAARQTPPSC